MSRAILLASSIFSIIALCGCQSTELIARNGATPDWDRRLARIEHSRLSSLTSRHDSLMAVSDDSQSPTLPASSAYVRGTSKRGASSTIPTTPANLAWNWTLSDSDEPAPAKSTDSDINWDEKLEKYNRRPPLPSLWETIKRDVKHAPEDIWRDTKKVYGNPVNLIILGTAYGGSLALQETGPDNTVEDHFDHAHRHFKGGWRDAFGAMGNPTTHFALAGLWYFVGQQQMDDKTYEVGRTLFSALAINGVTVMIGQAATWDKSPNGELGTFPSGHTSSSFVFASVMHEAYGHVVGIPLYGLAALVAHERLEDGEHYFSDVAMGAVLGTVIGHAVASGHDPEFFGWKIAPWANPNGGTGIAFVKTMK